MATRKKTATPAATKSVAKKKQSPKPETAITVTETEFAHVVAEPTPPAAPAVTAAAPKVPRDGSDEVKRAWALEQGRALLGEHAEVWISTRDGNGKDFRTPRFRVGLAKRLYSEDVLKTFKASYFEGDMVMWGVGSNWTGAVNFLKGSIKSHPTTIFPKQQQVAA